MSKLTEIMRFRFDATTAQILKKLPNKARFVRQAIIEKMEREKIISKTKIPF
jgi:hypothetical protein